MTPEDVYTQYYIHTQTIHFNSQINLKYFSKHLLLHFKDPFDGKKLVKTCLFLHMHVLGFKALAQLCYRMKWSGSILTKPVAFENYGIYWLSASITFM